MKPNRTREPRKNKGGHDFLEININTDSVTVYSPPVQAGHDQEKKKGKEKEKKTHVMSEIPPHEDHQKAMNACKSVCVTKRTEEATRRVHI